MKTFRKLVGVGLAALTLGVLYSHPVMAEPLMTMFSFSQSGYVDGQSNQITVTITRTDQDPATENQEFAVNCEISGGDAAASRDYNLKFNGAMGGLGLVSFPPGVHEQSFTINTSKTPGPNKTLQLALSDPVGPAPAAIGTNPVATVTIVNQ